MALALAAIGAFFVASFKVVSSPSVAPLPEEQVHMSGLCTAMHLDVLTSYRIEKEKAGRLVGAIRAARPGLASSSAA